MRGSEGPATIWNLDGVGEAEVVLNTLSDIEILAGNDGHVLASLPTGSLVAAAFVPGSKGGSLVTASTYASVSAYDFAAGFVAVAPLWTIPAQFQTAMLVGDVDGDGALDLVRPLDDGIEVLDPRSGVPRGRFTGIRPVSYYFEYQLANLDGLPGDEIVAIDRSYQYSLPTGVYAFKLNEGTLAPLWSSIEAPAAARGVDYMTVAGAVADLDGDGKSEFAYSRWDGAAWTTRVVDAATGVVLSSSANSALLAVGDVDGDGKLELAIGLEPSPSRTTISLLDFDSRAAGLVSKGFSLGNARVLMASSVVQPGPWAWLDVPPVRPGAARAGLLVGVDEANSGFDTALGLLRGTDGALVDRQSLGAKVSVTGLWSGGGLTASGTSADVLAFSDDGSYSTRTGQLALISSFPGGSFGDVVRVMPISSTRSAVVTGSSNRRLHFYDGVNLIAGAPSEIFAIPAVASSYAAPLSGEPADTLALLEGATPTYVVRVGGQMPAMEAYSGTGSLVWRQMLSPAVGYGTLYAVDANHDGTPDVLLSTVAADGSPGLEVRDGRDGGPLRSAALGPLTMSAQAPVGGALVDVNGDGVPELSSITPKRGDLTNSLSRDRSASSSSCPPTTNPNAPPAASTQRASRAWPRQDPRRARAPRSSRFSSSSPAPASTR